MRRIVSACIAGALVIGGSACSGLGQTGQSSDQPQFSPERIRADVTFLADDLLEGRGNGSRGYEIAARFVAGRFAALGLAPGNKGDWFQRVPFAESKLRPNAPAYLQIGDRKFVNGEDILISSTPLYPDQQISGDAVFAGFGLDAPAQGFDDYAGLDVRGKIAVVLYGFPPGSPSEMAAHLNSEKARMAQDRGAIGVITIHTPTYEKVNPWESRRKGINRASHAWVGPDGRPYSSAPKLQLSGSLGPAAAQALFANAPVPLATLIAQSEQQGGKPKGFPLAAKISAERHSEVTRISSPNVMGILKGSDPALANEYILLTGHLDAIGIVEPENGDTIVNGAMDNASGIATMLEVARAFKESGTRPKRSIMFVALAGEEKGLLGASYLAKNPVLGNGKIVGLVNLDMPMLTYDFQDVVAFGAEHSTIGGAVSRAIASANVKVSPDPEPEQVLFTRSDHYMFVKEGVPAVSLDTGPANGGAAIGADFIKHRYHKPGDDMRQKFDWNAAAKFARINYLIARELADAETEPRWYAGDFFGETFAKAAPKAPKP